MPFLKNVRPTGAELKGTRGAVVALALFAAACAQQPLREAPRSMAIPAYPAGGFVWCVPYARHISGIGLQGDARTWWDQAASRYERGSVPQLGAVLVLRSDRQMPDGHVAVVTTLEGARDIRVSHANWGWDKETRGQIYENMRAIDVSPDNDWTEVRFWHPKVGSFGRAYSAYGFIYPSKKG